MGDIEAMTAKSHNRGQEIEHDGKQWVDCKTGFTVSDNNPCTLCNRIPGDGGIDPCIIPLIKALNDGGVESIASCCGHGRRPGNIVLKDGRELVICRDFETARIVDKSFPCIAKDSS